MIFLSDDDGKVCGMVSHVNENKANEFVSVKHIGLYEEGQEVLKGEKVDPFSGALEEYTFEKTENGTRLKIHMDTIPEWEDYFLEAWPRALRNLKKLCE